MKNEVKASTSKGLFWSSLENVGSQGMNFIIQLILARILMPEDFGVIAILGSFINLANTFVQNGFGTALLRKKDSTETDFCSVFYMEIAIALLMYAIIFLSAPLIATFYGNSFITKYLRVFSLTIVIGAFSSIQTIVLRYRMDFRASCLAHMGGTIIQGVIGIVLALNGFGVWSLIISQLVFRLFNCFMLSISAHWFPKWKFSFGSLKELFSYSWRLFVGWTIGTVYTDAFSLIIGKAYNGTMLGFYTKGQSIPQVVNRTMTQIITAVMFPALAKVQNDKKVVHNHTRKMISISAALIFPVMAGIAAAAEAIVMVVLTKKWSGAIPVIQILCISSAINIVNNANMQSFNAIGRADVFLRCEIIKRSITIILVLICAAIDFYLMLFTIVFMGIVSLLLNSYYNVKLLGYSIIEQCKDLLPYIFYAIAFFGIVYPLHWLSLGYIWRLVIQVGLCAVLYIGSILFMKKGAFVDIKLALGNLIKRKKKPKEEKKEVKKLLLLGGSAQQIVAIETAKKLGYYTVLCDYLTDNPGQCIADKFYLVSTTDKEAVLDVARKEQVDGILAYASDPAAPTAAYVAEKMGLSGNPYESVEILCNKDKFRKFLSENGFCTPKAQGYDSITEAEKDILEGKFQFPIIVKPVDSSGSKGVSRIDNVAQIQEKLEYAMSFSRGNRIVVEEFVEKYGYQIAGDGLSIDGKLVFRCFANDHFNPSCVNPFVPISASFPYNMPDEVQDKIHEEIQRLISLLGMKTCTYNFDIRIDKDYNVYLMEIAPRDGGNYIPQLIKYATGIDLVECSVKAAMGETIENIELIKPKGYWCYYAVHSLKDGVLESINIAEDFKEHIVENHILKSPGDEIKAFTGANTTLGILLLQFEDLNEMLTAMDHSENWIELVVNTKE